eukprot:GHVT01086968.1.p1 GENE.GHVT01086968.1~~GHVT01086968.1.p1  ORF type:complete len:241 (-),score=21.34 GHVT01086968.1:64-786(-)
MHRFIREGPAARHDAHDPLLMDEAWHDANLRFIDRNHARAVRSDQTDVAAVERTLDLDHVVHRNAFCNTDDQLHAGIGCFQDRIGAKRRGHENQRGVALGFLHGIAHRVEHRNALDLLPCLARRHASDDLRPISLALRRMERAFLARDPLHHHPRILINENAHSSLFFLLPQLRRGSLPAIHGRYEVKSPLRASNEGLLRPRVARAQGLGPVPPSSPMPLSPSASQSSAPLPTSRPPLPV